jgi:hypothetical protein
MIICFLSMLLPSSGRPLLAQLDDWRDFAFSLQLNDGIIEEVFQLLDEVLGFSGLGSLKVLC